MSALHTPWIAHEYGSPKGHWFVRDSNGETINYPLAEREALLFAAAPDLFAALQMALTNVEMPTGIGLGFGGLEFRFPPWAEAARAAIARASGATS